MYDILFLFPKEKRAMLVLNVKNICTNTKIYANVCFFIFNVINLISELGY